MKDFDDFVSSIDIKEIELGTDSSLIESHMSAKEKKIVSSMCFGLILDMLRQYHEWADSGDGE